MNILIVGGDGKLGHALRSRLSETTTLAVRWTSRRYPMSDEALFLDMVDPYPDLVSIGRLQKTILDAVIIVAAVTGVVQCERDSTSWRINADAPSIIARWAARRSARPVFVSSDAVEVAPHTAYAKQKAYAELAVLAAGGTVVRPSRMATTPAYLSVADLLVDAARGADRGCDVLRWTGETGV